MTLLVARMIEEQFHRDDEGRPIREGRTPSEFLRAGEIEYKPCPYAGSRLKHENPMNVSALRQMSAHWDDVCDALAFLRTAHDQALGVTHPQLMDVWRVSMLGSSLPWFFLFRNGHIPAYAAALAKATLGQGIWAQRVLVKTLTERWTPPPLTAETMLALAEESGTLIGATEVCSGGDKMLLKFFAVLVGAPAPGRFEAPASAILRFGAHYANFKLYLWLYYLARRFLYADVVAQSGDSPELAALREAGVEPSDFFIVEPTNLAAVIPEQRMGWFRSLADLIVPFGPEGRNESGPLHARPARADLPLRDHGFQLAAVMGQGKGPAETFALLDELFGRVVAHVEAAFRGTPEPVEVPVEARDRLIGASPRQLFAEQVAARR